MIAAALLTYSMLTQTPKLLAWPVAPGAASVSLEIERPLPKTLVSPIPAKNKGTSLVILFQATPSMAKVVTMGNLSLGVKDGRVVPQPAPKAGWLKLDADAAKPHIVTVVSRDKDYAIYFDGDLLTSLPGGVALRTFLPVNSQGFPVRAYAHFNRRLTLGEIRNNFKSIAAGVAMADSILPDTPTITVEATLSTFTEVPDPARIKPYRNALVAQEYTVVSLVDGHAKGLKPGGKLRVFRYGIFDGKKTAIADEKAGDRVTLKLQTLESNPTLSREYQLDTLDTDVTATTYVEIPNGQPAGPTALIVQSNPLRRAALPATRPLALH